MGVAAKIADSRGWANDPGGFFRYFLLLALSANKPWVVYDSKDDTRVVKMSGKDLMRKKIG